MGLIINININRHKQNIVNQMCHQKALFYLSIKYIDYSNSYSMMLY